MRSSNSSGLDPNVRQCYVPIMKPFSKERACRLYESGLTTREVGEIMGCSHTTVRRLVGNLRETHNVLSGDLDSSFFISGTTVSEYWLGFIAADGCLHRHRPVLNLTSKDQDHVVKFKEALRAENAVGRYANGNWRLDVSSRALYETLLTLGLTPAKSHTLQPPPSLNHTEAYVRGFFDGDGYISFRSRAVKNRVRNPAVEMGFCSASEDFIAWLRTIIPVSMRQSKDRIWKLRLCNYKDTMSVLDWLYEGSDDSVRLGRKYDIYKHLCTYR